MDNNKIGLSPHLTSQAVISKLDISQPDSDLKVSDPLWIYIIGIAWDIIFIMLIVAICYYLYKFIFGGDLWSAF